MCDIEVQIQKLVVHFCKMLPNHVNKWESVIKDANGPLKALVNFSDQLRHIEMANIKDIDDFCNIQNKLQYQILSSIEEEFSFLKPKIEALNTANHELKNKLSELERSTIPLDFDIGSPLIHGTAIQPSLSRVLKNGLQFWTFFSNAVKKINESFKSFDVRNETSVQELENSFKINIRDERLTYLLALTQYVDNERAIT
ncbi:unnamed protein product [Brassicogethes aeneus]|uniref:Uncharacterized protein n=1 Tax=Brassicogethes aeneus TaxID=1431903 RepID=A0A9P0ATA9_BRAAE|nr:unnamed protein product [Brassicogethes aeneus]